MKISDGKNPTDEDLYNYGYHIYLGPVDDISLVPDTAIVLPDNSLARVLESENKEVKNSAKFQADIATNGKVRHTRMPKGEGAKYQKTRKAKWAYKRVNGRLLCGDEGWGEHAWTAKLYEGNSKTDFKCPEYAQHDRPPTDAMVLGNVPYNPLPNPGPLPEKPPPKKRVKKTAVANTPSSSKAPSSKLKATTTIDPQAKIDPTPEAAESVNQPTPNVETEPTVKATTNPRSSGWVAVNHPVPRLDEPKEGQHESLFITPSEDEPEEVETRLAQLKRKRKKLNNPLLSKAEASSKTAPYKASSLYTSIISNLSFNTKAPPELPPVIIPSKVGLPSDRLGVGSRRPGINVEVLRQKLKADAARIQDQEVPGKILQPKRSEMHTEIPQSTGLSRALEPKESRPPTSLPIDTAPINTGSAAEPSVKQERSELSDESLALLNSNVTAHLEGARTITVSSAKSTSTYYSEEHRLPPHSLGHIADKPPTDEGDGSSSKSKSSKAPTPPPKNYPKPDAKGKGRAVEPRPDHAATAPFQKRRPTTTRKPIELYNTADIPNLPPRKEFLDLSQDEPIRALMNATKANRSMFIQLVMSASAMHSVASLVNSTGNQSEVLDQIRDKIEPTYKRAQEVLRRTTHRLRGSPAISSFTQAVTLPTSVQEIVTRDESYI